MTAADFEAMGYLQVQQVAGRWCGLHSFAFTTGLVVGLDEAGYERRYCYEYTRDAAVALRDWNGQGHPGGPWIKCKGSGIDLLNPALEVLPCSS